MDKEKLTIKNFGPIESVELELGRFNVLIGEQATGKSTVAKVLAVCRYFSFITKTSSGIGPTETPFERGLKSWGLSEFIKKDSLIIYECKHYTFTAERTLIGTAGYKEMYTFINNLVSNSDEFTVLLDELKQITANQSAHRWTTPSSFFQNDVASVLDNPFYVFTERTLQSIFSLGLDSLSNISRSLFNYFADIDLISREFVKDTEIEPLSITYKNENGRHLIKTDKHDFLSLSNSASGYQSTIPIVLLIKYYTDIRKRNKPFIIEEPELNLFPAAQNELIKFMADKTLNYSNSLLITTHSPYILSSLNNLMYSYQVGKDNQEVENIIPQKYWVNPSDVSAYIMLNNGRCEKITDKEGLLRVKKIDGISSILNKEFNDVMNIELNLTNEKNS